MQRRLPDRCEPGTVWFGLDGLKDTHHPPYAEISKGSAGFMSRSSGDHFE